MRSESERRHLLPIWSGRPFLLNRKMSGKQAYRRTSHINGYVCPAKRLSTGWDASTAVFRNMKIISCFRLRSCFELFEMFFEVKKSSFYSRFFSQTAPPAIFLGRSGRTWSFSLSTQRPNRGQSNLFGLSRWAAGGDCLKSIITTSEDWKFVVAPVVGHGLFCSRRDFSDSLGGGSLLLTFKQTIQNCF